jgi:polyphosphate kinase 2 (PPK2 family)
MNLKDKLVLSLKGGITIFLNLDDWDPNYDAGKSKKDTENELIQFSSRLSELQYKLFADSSKHLLIILQGVDASGKDELFVK